MNVRHFIKVSALSLTLVAMVIAAPLVGARSVNADEAADKVKLAATERKVKLCEAKQIRIRTQLSRIGSKGEAQMEVFDSISTKVQAFYEAKGYNVANYSELVKAVTDARVIASDKVKLAITPPEFDCTKSDPKAGINTYKIAVKARSDALKDYKDAVHDLLLAVKNSNRQNTTKTTTDQTDSDSDAETTPATNETTTNDGSTN